MNDVDVALTRATARIMARLTEQLPATHITCRPYAGWPAMTVFAIVGADNRSLRSCVANHHLSGHRAPEWWADGMIASWREVEARTEPYI